MTLESIIAHVCDPKCECERRAEAACCLIEQALAADIVRALEALHDAHPTEGVCGAQCALILLKGLADRGEVAPIEHTVSNSKNAAWVRVIAAEVIGTFFYPSEGVRLLQELRTDYSTDEQLIRHVNRAIAEYAQRTRT